MASDKWAESFGAIDSLIREGNSRRAQEDLQKAGGAKVPRPHLPMFARLAWRAGLADVGIRALHPLVRPPARKPATASDEERMEYGICLVRAGIAEEGEALLKTIDAATHPRVLLYRAFAHFTRWEYREALPLLGAYCAVSDLDAYDRIVGQVNLAAALVHERDYVRAEYLLRELIHAAHLNRYRLLLGNALGLSAGSFLFQRRFDNARALVRKADELMTEVASRDAFFIRKWNALVDFTERPDESSESAVLGVREEAARIGHWETVRDCDRHRAIVRGDAELFLHLHFGTPFPRFRDRLAEDFPRSVIIPESYPWQLGGPGGKVVPILLGAGGGGGPKTGQLPHRLLVALTSDFYRPFRSANLFSILFRGEYHNPRTSPRRVHEAIRRARSWIAGNAKALRIEENKGFYSLVATKPCVLLVPRAVVTDKRSGDLETLRGRFGTEPFAARQAVSLLALPSRTVQRILEEAVEKGTLQREGRARATTYRFPAEPTAERSRSANPKR